MAITPVHAGMVLWSLGEFNAHWHETPAVLSCGRCGGVAMAVSASFKEFVAEQLSGVGPIAIRGMFGGAGIFADGLMFALIVADTLYLKTDASGVAAFEAEGSRPFSYETSMGTHTLASYWQVPERLFDEPDEMTAWARRAVNVAMASVKLPGKARVAKVAKPKPSRPRRR